MRSTCPNCLSQVEHPHGEASVLCTSCGATYSPFLNPQEGAGAVEATPGLDFSESALAFKEIVDFGQEVEPAEAAPKTKVPQPAAVSAPLHLTPESSQPSETIILTTQDLGPSYQVTQWFRPIVRMVSLGDEDSPLEQAFQDFHESALKLGANAVTGIRCSLAPDNKRALLMGTPVKCEKRPLSPQ